MARKRIPIDYNQMDKLLALQATLQEVAFYFNCSEDTIERSVMRDKKMTFKEYREIKKQAGLISLRRAQWRKATEKMDTTMLIFLGKQYLGQTDKIETESNIDVKNDIDFSGFPDLPSKKLSEMAKMLLEEGDGDED